MPVHPLLAGALADALERQEAEFPGYGVGLAFGPAGQEDQAFVQWCRDEDGGLTYVDVRPTDDLRLDPAVLRQLGFDLNDAEDLAALNMWTYEGAEPLREARSDEHVRQVLQDLLGLFAVPEEFEVSPIPGD